MRGSAQQWTTGALLAAALLADVWTAGAATISEPPYDTWWAIPSGVLMAGPAFLVSRRPIVAAVAAFTVLVGWSAALHLIDGRPADPVTPTAVLASALMVVSVVRRSPARTVVAVVVLLAAGLNIAEALQGALPGSVESLAFDAVMQLLVFGLPAAAGWYMRHRDTTTEAAVASARQRERVALARELHDVVAHPIGGIVIQAQAAQLTTAMRSPVLPVIEKAGTDALSAMRRMVTVLRDVTPDRHPAPRGAARDGGLAHHDTNLIAELDAVAATPPGGTPVRLIVDMTEPIPPEVETSVLRLVQESVANARRHATGAHEIRVTVRSTRESVRVLVNDDGRPDPIPWRHGSGFGVIGMRERVHLLGGRFSAGRHPDGGWQVLADLPLAPTGPARL